MEDLLRQIVTNTTSKESVSIAVKNTKTRIITQLDPPIELNRARKYEMALIDLESYYSFSNIDATRNSRWSLDAGVRWHNYKMPVGVYELLNIEQAIQNEIVKNSGDQTGIRLQPNKITLKTILKLKNDYRIDFNVENLLRSVLGFDAKLYDQAYVESENVVNILNVNTIHVHVECISGSYVDCTHKPIIHSFFPIVDPGHKI